MFLKDVPAADRSVRLLSITDHGVGDNPVADVQRLNRTAYEPASPLCFRNGAIPAQLTERGFGEIEGFDDINLA